VDTSKSFRKPITATFTRIRDGKFIDSSEERIIHVEVVDRVNAPPTLRFIGGPTGNESYYLGDLTHSQFGLKARLQQEPTQTEFSLCWGCNTYPRCTVPIDKLIEFIDKAIEDLKLNLSTKP